MRRSKLRDSATGRQPESYTNAQGVSYADENDSEKNWALLFDEQSEENYRMIMDMMEEIIKSGKDVRERPEWERRIGEKGKNIQV